MHYSVKVKEIKEKQVPELTDEFAKDVGSESLEELRLKVRDELVTKARLSAEKRGKEAVLDSVVRHHSLDVPDCMVQDELENHARRIAENLARQGIDVNKTSIDWRKVFEEERPLAEQGVRHSIVLDTIARQENLDVTDEELDAEFQKLAEGTHRSAAAVRAQFEKDKRIQDFREHVRRNKALDFIYRNASISGG